MSDYIKREDAIQTVVETLDEIDRVPNWVYKHLVDSLHITPSADVVEVVRCKDCKKRNTRTCMMNNNVGMNKDLFDNDYCSFGERKDGESE